MYTHNIYTCILKHLFKWYPIVQKSRNTKIPTITCKRLLIEDHLKNKLSGRDQRVVANRKLAKLGYVWGSLFSLYVRRYILDKAKPPSKKNRALYPPSNPKFIATDSHSPINLLYGTILKRRCNGESNSSTRRLAACSPLAMSNDDVSVNRCITA